MKARVLVAMSGGVDSSVAALLLKEQGFEVTGATMCFGLPRGEDGAKVCCGPEGIADAHEVCACLGIPHEVLDFGELFQTYVLDDFESQYRLGRTPNPCVRCNRYLKFDALLGRARTLGFAYVATGHYAAIVRREGELLLTKPVDRVKDQTYFLYGIERQCLEQILFPLHDMTKEQVRGKAREAGLPVSERQESQDLCFVGTGRSRIAVESGEGAAGEIVDLEGNVLGEHRGIERYTVGQRRGLGIHFPRPMHVVRIDPVSRRVFVGEKQDLLAGGAGVRELNLLVDRLPQRAQVKIRYAHAAAEARLERTDSTLRIEFAVPQESVTPGQSAVLYDGDTVLGGGIIDSALGCAGGGRSLDVVQGAAAGTATEGVGNAR